MCSIICVVSKVLSSSKTSHSKISFKDCEISISRSNDSKELDKLIGSNTSAKSSEELSSMKVPGFLQLIMLKAMFPLASNTVNKPFSS